jgi:hypothetical protein
MMAIRLDSPSGQQANGPIHVTLDVIEQLGEAQSAHQNTSRGRIATFIQSGSPKQ